MLALLERLKDDPQRYVLSSHGHSLYVNTLAERGAVGLATLLAVFNGVFWPLCGLLFARVVDE